MTTRNLADPNFEPTDEDFRDLLHAAGTDAREAHVAAESLVRERIRALRAAATQTATGQLGASRS